MQEFLSRSRDVYDLLERMKKLVLRDMKREYPDVDYFDENDLIEAMQDVYEETRRPFVVIIDEWDCIFREYKEDKEAQEIYLDFLRDMLKDKPCIHLAYMTGILPIKKYGTHSALNMFDEFSMIDPGPMAEYVGFTEEEVKNLCEKYHRDFEKVKKWYDGYWLNDYQVYNPKAVVSVMLRGEFKSYWSETASYETVVPLINMDFDGLRSAIIEMLSGDSVSVDVTTFQNDMTSFSCRDDVITCLIHFGYLGYNQIYKKAFVPNEDIRQELLRIMRRK